MIQPSKSGHYETMGDLAAAQPRVGTSQEGNSDSLGGGAELDARVAGFVRDHYDFIWRTLRRLGVPPALVDDATQKVFWVATRKLQQADVVKERPFLFAIALRVAGDERRSLRRHPEVSDEGACDAARDEAPPPDELVEQRQARALLDQILEDMPFELRVVFVLFELEEMSTAEIAALLEIPSGTVASRLRRGREAFEDHVARFRARRMGRGTP
jgi:RNA polymerase sigma-70 factor (ECF subfamily)